MPRKHAQLILARRLEPTSSYIITSTSRPLAIKWQCNGLHQSSCAYEVPYAFVLLSFLDVSDLSQSCKCSDLQYVQMYVQHVFSKTRTARKKGGANRIWKWHLQRMRMEHTTNSLSKLTRHSCRTHSCPQRSTRLKSCSRTPVVRPCATNGLWAQLRERGRSVLRQY